jgi:phosphoribosylamine---glycine ligase
MKVLVTGNGGREHALAWRAIQSPLVNKVYVAPGNAGTAREAGMENIDIDVMDVAAQIRFAIEHDIGLTIIGPEAPLVAGAVDEFTEAGLRCFGPGRLAAQLEGSKSFTKDFLKKYGIPTADYQTFVDLEPALDYLNSRDLPIVIKADGLAAGKGVIVAQDREEAETAVRDMLTENKFGDAGARVVIEDFLQGEEASFIVIADGSHFLPFASSQDHKAIDDGDMGPNTGGMGAYSPAPVVTPIVHQRIVDRVIQPTIDGMSRDGYPFTGFLYAGLMIDDDGNPRVIEFNCRFGDPETQPVMMRLESDLVQLCIDAIDGELQGKQISFSSDVSLTVVLAAGGYPNAYDKGDVIEGLDAPGDGKVFHAGTRLEGDDVVTNGGRVLGVTTVAGSVREAQQKAYKLAAGIKYRGKYSRSDIGYRAIAREQPAVK